MEAFFQPIKLSLFISFISLIIVTILGMLIGWVMEKKIFKGKVVLDTILLLPIVLPPTVIGFLLIIIFGTNGGVFGEISSFFFDQTIMFTIWAAVIAAVVVAFPLMYQSVRTGISLVDPAIEDAARVDGAGGEWRVFRYITLPLIKKSTMTGVVLAFARALGEFGGATLMFAGNIPGTTQTVPMAIYVAFESNKMGLAWAWVWSIIVVSFIMIGIIRKSA